MRVCVTALGCAVVDVFVQVFVYLLLSDIKPRLFASVCVLEVGIVRGPSLTSRYFFFPSVAGQNARTVAVTLLSGFPVWSAAFWIFGFCHRNEQRGPHFAK